MSISSLFYIIGGQYLISKLLQLVPISGYSQGYEAIKFLVLPVLISVIYGIGSGTRWYRSLFLEEIEKDYVKTAKSKGLSEASVLFKHVFKNALIPILTGVVVILPLLFLGSLTFHSFADHHDHYNFEEEHAAECQACEENVEIQISKSKTKKDYSKNSPSTNFISRFVEDKPESNLSRAPPVN